VLPLTYPIKWFVYNNRKYIMLSYLLIRLRELITNNPLPHCVRRYHVKQPVYIPPECIVFKVHESYKLQYYQSGNKKILIEGDWDIQGYEYNLLTTIRKIFIQNENYKNTEQYTRMVHYLNEGNYLKSYKTTNLEEVDQYFSSLAYIWTEIKNKNFKTQHELGGWLENEVGVVIDRDGRIGMSHHGQHRVAMAKLNKLSSIPVLVLSVHKEWYARCMCDTALSGVDAVEQCIQRAINQ
jgi:hypothetical protein